MYTFSPATSRPKAAHRRTAALYARFDSDLTSLLEALGIGHASDDVGPVYARCEARTPGDEPGLQIHEAVELAKEFVEAHTGEDLDLDRLAEEAGISKFYLVRLFREAEGTTPWAYVRAARIRKAKELLEEDLPLVDVALLSGFYDQSHFSRAFREAEGKTPGQYREDRKNIQD